MGYNNEMAKVFIDKLFKIKNIFINLIRSQPLVSSCHKNWINGKEEVYKKSKYREVDIKKVEI